MGTIFEASFCRLAATKGRGGSKQEGVLGGNGFCGRLLRLEAATGDGRLGVPRGEAIKMLSVVLQVMNAQMLVAKFRSWQFGS